MYEQVLVPFDGTHEAEQVIPYMAELPADPLAFSE